MKKLKKGFTIVELVIVIAVIAILAAVLIPVFSNVVDKANKSKDTQLVRNLNTALSSDLGEHNTMYDALQAAKEYGYDVGKINASATDNEILWDSKNDCFVYLDDGVFKYIPNSKTVEVENLYDYWLISSTVSTTYSTYYTGSETEVTVTTGFDAGEKTGIKVNVDLTTLTEEEAERTLTIRANSVADTYKITAPKANIKFYGTAGEVNVEAVKDESLHIYGAVEFLQVKAGRVVAEDTAVVKGIHVAAATAKVEIEDNAVVEVVTKQTGLDNVTVEGYTETIEAVDAETAKAGAKLFAAGNGSEALPFIVKTVDQFMNIAQVESDEVYVELANDIDFAGVEADYAYITLSSVAQIVDVNLNGKTINGVQVYLFAEAANLSLYNGTINFNCTSGVAGVTYGISYDYPSMVEYKFEDLVLNGLINVSKSHYGALVSYAFLRNDDAQLTKVSANNVENNVKIVNEAANAYTGGLFGYIGGDKTEVSITNCTMNGSIQSALAGGFINPMNLAKVVTNEGNVFGGTILASKTALVFGLNKNQDDAVVSASTANINVVEASTTLVDKDAAIGSEVVINHTNSEVVRYVVTVEYWVKKISDGTGGYPRYITIELTAEELGELSTGLFKYKFVQASESNDAANIYSGAQIWANDGVYNVYDEHYEISGNNNNIRVSGYNSNGVLVTYQDVSYSNN